MCVLILYNFHQNNSHAKKNSVRYYHKCACLDVSTFYSCNITMELEFLQQIFKEYSISFIHSFIHSLVSALEARLAGTRAQSCDRCGSGTLHPAQVLGGGLPLLSPDSISYFMKIHPVGAKMLHAVRHTDMNTMRVMSHFS